MQPPRARSKPWSYIRNAAVDRGGSGAGDICPCAKAKRPLGSAAEAPGQRAGADQRPGLFMPAATGFTRRKRMLALGAHAVIDLGEPFGANWLPRLSGRSRATLSFAGVPSFDAVTSTRLPLRMNLRSTGNNNKNTSKHYPGCHLPFLPSRSSQSQPHPREKARRTQGGLVTFGRLPGRVEQ
jgi:hypothetical protein